MEFKPERFLKQKEKSSQPNLTSYAFGFGRRICPGRFFALDAVWLMVTCILATFDIAKALDEDGEEVEVVVEHTQGALKCRFVPRSPEALSLLQSGFLGYEVAE
ncbi:hypothetical protein VKT23_018859 [Stygiomarasmius scandens]|uniref:Cytochrome P450 n=1 Tax=Marasmiellus scandens TaxID=2682957 RepID=A0ABR1IQH4_9AGAR